LKVATFKVAGYAGYAGYNLSLREAEKPKPTSAQSLENDQSKNAANYTPHTPHTPQAFYQDFCSQPDHHLRLCDDGSIGIGVPESMSNEEFQQVYEMVMKHEGELRALLQRRP
jgi:hypothetical protein